MAEAKAVLRDRIVKHLQDTQPIVSGVALLKEALSVIDEQKKHIDTLTEDSALSALFKAAAATKKEIAPDDKYHQGLNALCDGCRVYELSSKWKIQNDKLYVGDDVDGEGDVGEVGDVDQITKGQTVTAVSTISDRHRERLEYVLDPKLEIAVESDAEEESDIEEPPAKRQHTE